MTWKTGDLVRHAQRPEWGQGAVIAAEPASFEGRACQRLTVRFERGGVKVLSTGPAVLTAARETAENAGGGAASEQDLFEKLAALPERAQDPFVPGDVRLRRALELYRFNEEGASLLDWAAAQTGVRDALARWSRHELESQFARFRIVADQHLARVARELRVNHRGELEKAAREAPPRAREVLRRLGF